jgi:trans-aconitate methyltransferase
VFIPFQPGSCPKSKNNEPVLELGCGEGADSVTLLDSGVSLIAIDICAESIAQAKKLAPAAQFHQQDIRDPWPVEPSSTSVVIASLCLHYFSWPETVDIVRRIHDALHPGGLLLCRLNSTNDHNYGAIGYPEIAENYYSVNGEPKRFFDKSTIENCFKQNGLLLNLPKESPTSTIGPRHFGKLW